MYSICRHNDDEELLVQLDVFEEQRLEDEDDLSSPEGVNLTSHLDVFHALFRKVCLVPLSFASAKSFHKCPFFYVSTFILFVLSSPLMNWMYMQTSRGRFINNLSINTTAH